MDYKEAQEKLNLIKDYTKELIELGGDYGYFQSAKATHSALKKVNKLLTNVR